MYIKRLVALIAIALCICVLSACEQSNPVADPTPAITEIPVPEAPKEYASPDAKAIAQAWLDNHPIHEPNILMDEFEDAEVDGEAYYAFFVDSIEVYWFSILVHKETGEMLCRISSDGEYPTVDIEPLDDWYSEVYGD